METESEAGFGRHGKIRMSGEAVFSRRGNLKSHLFFDRKSQI